MDEDPIESPPATPARRRHRYRAVMFIVVGIALGVLGSILFGLASGREEPKPVRSLHAVTRDQFDFVPLGISRAELEMRLGKPKGAQEVNRQRPSDPAQIERSSCLYYPTVGRGWPHVFQFCFVADSLKAKNAY